MSDEPEVTREGLFEEIVGKTKEAMGELVGNEHLAESGRDQQARAEAEADGAETTTGTGEKATTRTD